ncbi:TraC family protein [Alteromonas gracilis]|uniref:TraC family protein n=1 Tax=Alteromonas gracilis TaxID=1479524 RepID=UPI003735878C
MGIFQSSAKLAEKLTRKHCPGDLFPYIDYMEEDKIFVLDDGYIGAVWDCRPINGTAKEIEDVVNSLLNKDYPEGVCMSFMLFASQNIADFKHSYQVMRGGRVDDSELNNLYSGISRGVVDWLDEGVKKPLNKSGMKMRNYDLYISFKMPVSKKKRKEDFVSAREMYQFRKFMNIMDGALTSAKLMPRILDEEGLLYKLQSIFNWSDRAPWRKGRANVDASRTMREQIFDIGNGIRVDDEGGTISVKDKVITPFSVSAPPNYMFFGRMINLTGDWEKGIEGYFDNYAHVLNVEFPDRKKAMRRFSNSRGALKHQVNVGLAKLNERIKLQADDFDKLYQKIEVDKEKLIEWSLHFLTFTDKDEDVEGKAEDFMNYLKSRGFSVEQDQGIALPLIMNCMPLVANTARNKFLDRMNKDTSSVAGFFMPIYASWRGNAFYNPMMPYITRTGQLFGFNPFISDTNYNMLVCATSGAGKSFWTNGYVANLLTSGKTTVNGLLTKEGMEDKSRHPLDGGIVYIIDVGGSYAKLCDLYKGQNLQFNNDFDYSLNPWPMVDEWEGEEGMAEMVFQIHALMAFEVGEPDAFQTSRLRSIINQVWNEKAREAHIDDVAKLCLADEDRRVRDMGHQLKEFCPGGTNYRYFRKDKKPVNFNSNFVLVELEELKSKPHLQKIVLLQVFSNIQFSMYLGDKNRRKSLIIDEGWEWIKGDNKIVGNFLETGWRRFRKYNSNGILITQSYRDTKQSSVGEALSTNSKWKMILKQGSGEVKKMQQEKMLDVTDSQYELMSTVATVPKQYSEIYIDGGDASEVVRFIVPRFEQLLYTTAPEEVAAIQKYTKKGLSLIEAIREVMKEEGSS